jgi:hypothetical protein
MDHLSHVGHKTSLVSTSLGKDLEASDMTVWESLTQIKEDMKLFQTVLQTVKQQVQEQDQVGSLVVDKMGPLLTAVMNTNTNITTLEKQTRGLESMKGSATKAIPHYNCNIHLFHSKRIEIEKRGQQLRCEAPLNNAFQEEMESLKANVLIVREMLQEHKDPSNAMEIDNSDLNSQFHNTYSSGWKVLSDVLVIIGYTLEVISPRGRRALLIPLVLAWPAGLVALHWRT